MRPSKKQARKWASNFKLIRYDQEKIHRIALDALRNAQAGNPHFATELVKSLATFFDPRPIVFWFEYYGALYWNKEKQNFELEPDGSWKKEDAQSRAIDLLLISHLGKIENADKRRKKLIDFAYREHGLATDSQINDHYRELALERFKWSAARGSPGAVRPK